ncbi:MAG: hypothetical protein ACLFMO_07375 [Eubacteriales bacterium]
MHSCIKGKPIFKDYNKAFSQALVDYKDVINAIAKEFNLKKLNKNNYQVYKTYGWELTTVRQGTFKLYDYKINGKKSSTGIYHIMLRGIDKRNIFLDDEDRKKFIEDKKG